MKYKVTIEPRENCISCCNCHTNCPDVFELNPDDGLSQIKEEFRYNFDSNNMGDVPDALEECVRVAEDLCPVTIIHVVEQN